MKAPDIFVPADHPHGIAHRGSRLLWPENTEVAFRGAAEFGYRLFETDLRVTADGVLVCFHDPVLNRTTNGRGFIANNSFDDLRRLDAGYRHRVDGDFPFRGKGLVVPSFVEMVEAFPGSGWVVDLKADHTETLLADAIDEFGLAERVIVGSFSTERIARFRNLTNAQVPTSTPPAELVRAMVATAASGRPLGARLTGHEAFHPSTVALQVPATWYGVLVVTGGLVRTAHDQGRLVHVWTVNDPSTMKALAEMGVDGLITDRADLLPP
ncbi:MAG: glycerophosphodiester phosphodiesterase [Acidimicrobiia bacterium]